MPDDRIVSSRRMLMLLAFLASSASPITPVTAAPLSVSETCGQLRLHFEANRGQTHEDVRFLSRGPGYSLYLTAGEAVLVLARPNPDGKRDSRKMQARPDAQAQVMPVVLRMAIVDAAPKPLVSGLEELPGKANYFIGKDRAKWRTNVPTYAKVHYREVYPGIDLLYYGNQRQLEYDFVVAPGADPKKIVLGFQGAERLEIDAEGELVLHAAGGSLRQRKPVIYQEIDGIQREIDGGYVLKGANRVGFQVAAYDASHPLIIDPVLDYSTYLGGASGGEQPHGIAVDGGGNAYVTGRIASTDFPTTMGAFDTTHNGGGDAFVTKLDPTGSSLVYSTYLGGSGEDVTFGIAVDAAGNAYVTGNTNSTNFPTTPGAFDTTLGSIRDAFVTKLDPTGSSLVYSTYLGGSLGLDEGFAIAVDALDNAYVTGSTTSTDFPTTAGAFRTTSGNGGDAFVTKLNPTGSALVYSTYLTGSLGSDVGLGIAVDALDSAYVTGRTSSTSFPTTMGAFQTTSGGGNDAFVTKLNFTGSALVYSTYLGGSGTELEARIAVDALGNAYVTGHTDSTNFPTTAAALQPSSGGGGGDAFVTKLDPSGSALVYSTYLGGSGVEIGLGIAVDALDNAYVTGVTTSNNFPTTAGAFLHNGAQDAFVTKVNPTGSALVYSTYLGGAVFDRADGIAVDALGSAYVTGITQSTNFPTTVGAFQTTLGGSSDAFVAKIAEEPIAHAGPDQTVDEGTQVTLDGSGSSGGPLTYQWTQVAGSPVSLNLTDPVHPTFTAPQVPVGGETLTFQLVVNDGQQASQPDQVDIMVKNLNTTPVCDAGAAQMVNEGGAVTLDGSGSYDPDGDALTYAWSQTSGSTVVLSNPDSVMTNFTAPIVGPAGETLAFELAVGDGTAGTSCGTTVQVIDVNQKPAANAGPDQTKNEGTAVSLDGTGSTDPDGDPLTYAWSQVSGPAVVLSDPSSAMPSFTAPAVDPGGENLVFQLVVHDGQLASDPDTVEIMVLNVNDPPVCSLAQPSPASLWPPNHGMVPVSITNVADPNNDQVVITVTAVTQDEPVSGSHGGDTSPDAVIQGSTVLLRAERSASGNGRVYAVHFTADDGEGGTCSGVVAVEVPRTKKGTAVDDGQLHDSTLP